jgi:hypothetical protein
MTVKSILADIRKSDIDIHGTKENFEAYVT